MRKILIACVCTAMITGATSATAAKFITGSDIKDGTIKAKDIAPQSISLNRLSGGTQDLIKADEPVTTQSDSSSPVQGAKGETGARGTNGLNGADGGRGDKGDKGDKGDQGLRGPKGDNGLNGGDARAVSATSLFGWTLLSRGTNPDPTDNGTLFFRTLPAPTDTVTGPPLGTGALELTTTNGKNVSAVLPMRPGNDKPRLSELTTLTYSDFVSVSPAPGLGVAMKIEVTGADRQDGNPSGYTTLVFEPAYNQDQNTSALDVWQRWYVADGGKVWSTRALTGIDCAQSSSGACTIEEFVAANPRAVVQRVRLEVGQNSGDGWGGFRGMVDDVRLGYDGDFARYDFELAR